MAAKIPRKYLGYHAERLAEQPEEQRFAAAWAAENERNRTLDRLLTEPVLLMHSGYPVEMPGPIHETAATAIQWLGSPDGQSFLKQLGYEKKPGR